MTQIDKTALLAYVKSLDTNSQADHVAEYLLAQIIVLEDKGFPSQVITAVLMTLALDRAEATLPTVDLGEWFKLLGERILAEATAPGHA